MVVYSQIFLFVQVFSIYGDILQKYFRFVFCWQA